MYSSSFLVLLYDESIRTSTTLTCLLSSKLSYRGCNLTIWNNGPRELKIDEDYLDLYRAKGFSINIIETIDNRSLAKIYNSFLDSVSANRYILLDHDSAIVDDYLSAASISRRSNISIPIITSLNQTVGPFVNGKVFTNNLTYKEFSDIKAIGSGLVLGCDLISLIKAKYGKVFDERFVLYGVDTTFFYRLNSMKLFPHVKFINGFEHSLSRLLDENEKMSNFRLVERSFDKALRLRYYTEWPRSSVIFVKVIFIYFFRVLTNKGRSLSLWHFIQGYLSGKHYRN